jgi:hypothetical protein
MRCEGYKFFWSPCLSGEAGTVWVRFVPEYEREKQEPASEYTYLCESCAAHLRRWVEGDGAHDAPWIRIG